MSRPPTTQTVLSLDFGIGGNSGPHTAAGWSDPESRETWCVGPYSRLTLPPLDRIVPHVLLLDLRPHVHGEELPAQRVRVSVGGTRVAAFVLRERGLRACVIPAASLRAGEPVDIVFETPDARRPSLFGRDDDRALAVAFASARLFAERPASGTVPALDGAAESPAAELMMRFESLGENCEFGLVQRFCEAEPNDLLRFASAPLPNLMAALEAGFEGMGQAESVHVELSSNGREFLINDLRYGLGYHAWAWAGRMTAEALREREARRLPPLLNRFLAGLRQGAKIYVYKGMGALDEELVYPLAVMLRRHGPNTLLFVTLADEQHLPGTVELRAPGFIVGYVRRFAPADDANDLLGDQWLGVCRRAMALAVAQVDPVEQPDPPTAPRRRRARDLALNVSEK